MKKKIANNKSLIITLMFLFAGLMPVCGAEIHDAAIDGNLAEVKSLLTENPQLVNAKDGQNSSSTPLHMAAANNHKDIVELLITVGAQVNAKDKLGSTPLHWAAYNGHKDIVDLLIANKAQVSAKTAKRDQTPLCWATCRGHKEIVELLIAKGAEVNTKDGWEQTPLHRAAEKNRKDVLEVLIANRARLNAKDRWGNTALHVAAYYGHKDIVEVLIASGADVNDKTKTGWTPLRMALHSGHQETAELLQKYEPSPTLVGELGEPARLSFEGIKTFTPKKIRDGLMVNPDFLLASHPAAPFSRYLEAVQKNVQIGYKHNGFPEVRVTTTFDKSAGKIAVKVVEGPRYICGDVRVTGLKTLSTEPFIRRLTRPRPPPESADILPKFQDQKSKDDFFAKARSSLEVFRYVNSAGEIVRQKPIWQKGEPASFSDYSLKLLNEQVKAVLSEFGYFFPALEVKVIPEPNNATAQLLVQILDEGPKGTIGVIEVTGNVKNTREEILKYLGLEVGMEISRDLITKTEYLLWRSARFLDYKVTPGRIDPRTPKLKLSIYLTEYEPAPSLFKDKDFSPAEKTLLKLADFLSGWPSGQDDLVISGHSKVYGTDMLQAVISPQKGMLFMVKETDPAFQGPVRAAAVFSPDKVALFSPPRQRKLVFPRGPGYMEACLFLLPNRDPESKFEKPFRIGLTGGVQSEKSRQPWRVYARIAPVASVDMAHRGDITYSSDKEILEINGKGYQLKVDSESGKPIELVLSKNEKKGEVRVIMKEGAFDQVMNQIEKATAQCRNEFKPQEPFSSTLAYLAEEQVLQKLFVQSSSSRKVTPEQLASAATVLARILEKRPLAPLEGLILKGPAEGGEDFTLPQDSPQTSGASLQRLLTKFSAIVFKWCNDLFPQRSWPWTIAREAVFVFGGVGRYTTTELQRIYESKETGPIGCLATGNLLNVIKWPQWPHARAFADRGLERLSADDFRNDWRLLIEGESVLAQCLVRTAEAFRDLDDEDIEALVLLLPPERATFVRNSVRLLREEKGKPVGEVLRPALDEYWEKVLKKRVEAALRKLAIKTSRRRPPIQAANRDYKKLISNLACVALKAEDADVLAADNDGQTPLYTVSGVGRENVTDLLRRHGAVE